FMSTSFCRIRLSLLLSFLFQHSPAPRDLHSFPTRRSSDLWGGLKCRRGWLHVAAQTRRRSHDQPAVVTLVGRPFGGALYDAPHGTPRACEGASDDPSWPQTRKRHAVCRRASRTARTARRKDGKPCND